MLLKWLFTLLAILWLYQALRPFFVIQRPHQPPPPPTPPPEAENRDVQKSRTGDKGEYIDYEEVE